MSPALPAGARARDGTYTGIIECDTIPERTSGPLRTDFVLSIKGNRASYERELLKPTSAARMGVTERGTGTISEAGQLTLVGGAGAQTWSYQGTYKGQFEGTSLRLSGAQEWRLAERGARSRPCTIRAVRSG